MTDKLPIAETLTGAWRMVFAKRADLYRLGGAATFAIFITAAAARQLWSNGTPPVHGQEVTSPQHTVGVLAVAGLQTLFVSMFAVAWHRLILLGPESVAIGLGLRLGQRELLYLGRMWLCLLLLCVVIAIAAVIEVLPFQTGKSGKGLVGLLIFVTAIFGGPYLGGRWSLVFAATAIDREFSFVKSWRATAGNGARLLGIYLLAGLATIAIFGIFHFFSKGLDLSDSAPYAMLFLNDALICVVLAVLVTINAGVFRQLVDAPGPA